jgi:uncharacterized protein YecE (DUF72 family)
VSDKRAESTFAFLSERDAAFVAVDAPRAEHVPIMPSVDAVTNDALAYMRLHGRDEHAYMHGRTVAERFAYEYSDDELEEVAGRVRALAEEAREVHVLFNNNRGADAPSAASRFRELIGQDPGPPPDAGQQLQMR